MRLLPAWEMREENSRISDPHPRAGALAHEPVWKSLVSPSLCGRPVSRMDAVQVMYRIRRANVKKDPRWFQYYFTIPAFLTEYGGDVARRVPVGVAWTVRLNRGSIVGAP